MAIKRLSTKDVEQLLAQYRSERRRLNFQLDKVRAAITELKGSIGPGGIEVVVDPVKRGPGRPRKDPSQLASAKQKTGRKKREIKDGGYRLPDLTPKDVEDKLTRVLQKLSGKRQILGTHRTGMIRGYHYGIMDWFFASSGKLRKQHFERIDYNVEPND